VNRVQHLEGQIRQRRAKYATLTLTVTLPDFRRELIERAFGLKEC
jgi:hypothetical protein